MSEVTINEITINESNITTGKHKRTTTKKQSKTNIFLCTVLKFVRFNNIRIIMTDEKNIPSRRKKYSFPTKKIFLPGEKN